MPNHVKNILTFNVDNEELQNILDYIKDDKKGIGSIDFNKLIPMPPELDIEKGSNLIKGKKLFEKYSMRAERAINILNDSENLTPERLKFAKAEHDIILMELEQMSDEEQNLFALGKQYYDNVSKYGVGDWYDWHTGNWGTKWNAYNFSYNGNNTIEFSTANTTPSPIIKFISEQYPDITINHRWADEDKGTNLGEREYIKGDVVYQHIPDAFSKEAYDMAFDIWHENPEEYGLMLNAAGTEYISIDEQETPMLPEAEDEDDLEM